MTDVPKHEDAQGPEKSDAEQPELAVSKIPKGDWDWEDMLDIERRIKAGGEVSDEERTAYEKASAEIRETLRSIRIPAQAFHLPAGTQEAISEFLRNQQQVTEGLRKQIRDTLATIQVPNFSIPQIAVPKITAPTYPFTATPAGLQLQPSHSHRPEQFEDEVSEESDELEVRPEAIEVEPVGQFAALKALADQLEAQQDLTKRSNEIAEQQVEETKSLNDIMKIVKNQSDAQGKFAKRMAWFMAAVGVGTIFIPTWQLITMLNSG